MDVVLTLWSHAGEHRGSMHIDGDTLSTWRERLTAAKADETWRSRWARDYAQRTSAAKEVADLLTRFIAGDIPLGSFAADFDRGTRGAWKSFGFGGASAAMFLNQLVKHASSEVGVDAMLRKVLTLPADDAAARAALEELRRYLANLRADGVLSGSQASEGRIPFFVSGCWHVQRTDAWPPFYPTARAALRESGLYRRAGHVNESYFAFRDAFVALAAALDLGLWQLEAVCMWEEREPALEEPEPEVFSDGRRVWLVAPGRNASLWDAQHAEGVIAIGWAHLGDLSKFESSGEILERLQELSGSKKKPYNNARACFQFASEMKPGDVVVAKKGKSRVVGYGRVTGDYRFDPKRGHYPNVRSVDWLHKGVWSLETCMVLKALTEITGHRDLVREIVLAIGVEKDADEVDEEAEDAPVSYELADAAADLFITPDEIQRAWDLLRYKRNLVLEGPPGVGKTFVAKRLAYLMMGAKDASRVSVVQFHQSYSYEDFVQGYRPAADGNFVRGDGPFMRIANLARQDLDAPYVLVIDEINRGNLSKIFGELMMLIEADKRRAEWGATLAYGTDKDAPFHVPPNLYLIGTMNTADRSLAMVDYALRRRFAFYPLGPGFASKTFVHMLKQLEADAGLRDRIATSLTKLNKMIRDDPALGEGFEIGHSYFCSVPEGGKADDDWFDNIVTYEIVPLLREYWFDDRAKVDTACALLEDDPG